ncbi:hypothetical protein HD806DRAFT_81853 [Xylariaceae sp. AK1471]|nr:hypothetical protein HD806DRAFT_81853 [Xylariaceae sp. AK1471]
MGAGRGGAKSQILCARRGQFKMEACWNLSLSGSRVCLSSCVRIFQVYMQDRDKRDHASQEPKAKGLQDDANSAAAKAQSLRGQGAASDQGGGGNSQPAGKKRKRRIRTFSSPPLARRLIMRTERQVSYLRIAQDNQVGRFPSL